MKVSPISRYYRENLKQFDLNYVQYKVIYNSSDKINLRNKCIFNNKGNKTK